MDTYRGGAPQCDAYMRVEMAMCVWAKTQFKPVDVLEHQLQSALSQIWLPYSAN